MSGDHTHPSYQLCRQLCEASEACDFAACAIESSEDDGDTSDVEDALLGLQAAEAAIIQGRLRLLAIQRGDL
ncbi:MAG TPA: hypothetical protein VG937_30225 [Polyangiaceae bacterium]|nr:hypothetical protein [Polyangiaceae bacterium]